MSKRKRLSPPGPDWKAAEEYGIDVSLIEASLRKTPAERIRVHSHVRAMVRAVEEAARKRNA